MGSNTRSEEPKKRSKRYRINISVTAEQHAQLLREVPDKELSQYCRDRIFNPSGLRDPVVDVGARLLAMAAKMKCIVEQFNSLEKRMDDDLARAQDLPDDDPENPFQGMLAKQRHLELTELIVAVLTEHKALLEEVREVRRLIAIRQERSGSIPRVEKRTDR